MKPKAQKPKHARSLVGAGFVALDVIKRPSAASAYRLAGGSCANVAAILSYFGWSATLIARIGHDRAGDEVVNDLRRWAVDTKLVRRDRKTSTPLVFQTEHVAKNGSTAHRFKLQCPDCGSFSKGYRPVLLGQVPDFAELPQTPTVFYFDRVSPSNLEMARRAAEVGALVVFEPSGVRDERLFLDCLRTSHIFKYSHERLPGISKITAGASVPLEIETLGSRGIRLAVRSKKSTHMKRLPPFAAPQFADAAGSGDWCTAGLIHSIASANVRWKQGFNVFDEKMIEEAISFGQALAALNCAFQGARGIMYSMTRFQLKNAVARIMSGGSLQIKLKANAMRTSERRPANNKCPTCGNALE